MEQLPQAEPGLDQGAPCGDDDECSPEEYSKWLSHASKLHSYIRKIPKDKVSSLNLTKLHTELVSKWGTSFPIAPDADIDKEDMGLLLSWIQEAETIVYYVTYMDHGVKAPGVTTPGELKVVEIPAFRSQWPWIDGWQDPKKRELILRPKTKPGMSMGKKVLVLGALGAATIYIGNKITS